MTEKNKRPITRKDQRRRPLISGSELLMLRTSHLKDGLYQPPLIFLIAIG
jgi:hypothetical protein